jgi:hypothetical protein
MAEIKNEINGALLAKDKNTSNTPLGVTVYTFKNGSSEYKQGFMKGVAFTTFVIAACATSFWLGMNRSEEIIKKKDTEIAERDKQIVQLNTLVKSERKTAQKTINELADDILSMTQAAKEKKWNNFYKAIGKAKGDAEKAKNEYLYLKE